ncbi:two-component sensor histidine kinase BarA [Celerinatantimonas sp. YJH-8]|uniref:two-component sensor histidine kinase BarA n=1 Tax=Celerinatantimonas sp. YJH-8 TaxID=3228714 RepID=UPI0038CBA109
MTKYGLRARVYILTILPTLLIGGLLASYFSFNRNQQLEQFAIQQGIDVIEPLAIASEFGLSRHSRERVKQVISISHRKQSPQIHSIAVFDDTNQLFVTSNYHSNLRLLQVPQGRPLPTITEIIEHPDYIIVRAPIWADGEDSFSSYTNARPELLGYIALRLDKERALLLQFRDTTIAVFIVIFGLFLSVLFSYQLVRNVTRPIGNMVRVVDRIRQGRLDARVDNSEYPGELEMLKRGINAMAKSLAEYHEEMHQSIDQATSDLRETLEQIEIQNIDLDIAKKEAQQAARVKSEFLANMSHELRTPLNGVLGFARQLQKTPLNREQRDFLQTIENSATNLLSIINDILDFSKLEAGQLSLERIAFHLFDTTTEVVTLLAHTAHDKHLELVLDIDPSLPSGIYGDPLRYQQVLTNLIGNALKFTTKGSVEVHLSAHPDSQDRQLILQISIKDTGIGIPKDQQKILFQAFRQADTSISRQYGGTGLGLVITRRLIQQMGGDITLESEPGQGSVFSFTITCEIADLTLGDPLPLDAIAHQTLYLFEPMEKTRQSLENIFRRWPLQLVSFDSFQALKTTLQQQNNPHSISVLLGATFQQSQEELQQQVQEVAPLTHNLLIAVLSHDPQFVTALLQSGATHCLVKPIQYRKLAEQLSNQTQQAEPELSERARPDCHQLNVLAVDDNPANLKLITTMLYDLVTGVDGCMSGTEALEKIAQHHYDLIFMDIQMPGMDGISTSAAIKQSYPDFKAPIVAVTAHASPGDKERLLKEGLDDYMSKPIDETELVKVIERCCPDAIKISSKNRPKLSPEAIKLAEKVFTSSPVYNWNLALERSGKRQALAEEMLKMLKDSLPGTRQKIEQALAGKLPADDLEKVIHKFHGGCAYTGAKQLQTVAKQIETALRQGQNCTDVEPELLELLDEMHQLEMFDSTPPWKQFPI